MGDGSLLLLVGCCSGVRWEVLIGFDTFCLNVTKNGENIWRVLPTKVIITYYA